MNLLTKIQKIKQILLFSSLITTLVAILVCSVQNFDTNDLFFFRLNKSQSSKITKGSDKEQQIFHESTIQSQKKIIRYIKTNSLQNILNHPSAKNENQRLSENGLIVYEEGDDNYFYFEGSKILEDLQNSLKFTIKEGNKIQSQTNIQDLIKKAQNYLQVKEFQYGNWCGPNYGGFESKCRDVCLKNAEEPSDKCIDCRPFINYVDRVCMEHDFCQQRYENKVNKEKTGFICAYKALNVGQYFQTRCECTYFILESLKQENLIKNCDSLSCLSYGYAAEKAFNNILFDCGCYYTEYHRNVYTGKMYPLETQKCVSPSECKSFRGK